MEKWDNIVKRLTGRIGAWQIDHIGQRNFLILLSLVVGIASGLSAVVLKHAILFVKSVVVGTFVGYSYNVLLFACPVIGVFITLLYVRYAVRDSLSHGVTKILYAISQSGSSLKRHHCYSSIVASSFTIGFGGSVGAEAPIALTGASIGSNIGKLFRLDYKTLTLLMACGAAGGIAGVFKAPIAGMVFALEILMLNLTLASIVPLLISAISSTAVTYYFLGHDVEFSTPIDMAFSLANIPFYLLLGIFSGFVALMFTRGLWTFERHMGRVGNVYLRWLAGSVVMGSLIFLFPPLYGEGYTTISDLLNGRESNLLTNSLFAAFGDSDFNLIVFAALVLCFKTFATAATTGAGGVGGTFAPSLFLGGVAGYFFSKVNNMIGWHELPTTNFTLVGMAGVMAAVMHAPLTSIFLIAEITNGYQLLLPLMATSTVAYLTICYFEPNSIYTKPLADKGELLTHERDKTVLTLMHLDRVIETDFLTIQANATLGQMVQIIAASQRNLFPVINDRNELIGVVLLNDIRTIMFNKAMYNTTLVRELMIVPPAFIQQDECMESVMNKFEQTGAWNLPVVDGKRYVGFVSKSKIFSVYRRVLMHVSYE